MSYLRTFDSWADGVKQTLNPDGTSAGLNVGAHTADPSALVNGDVWYQSTANELRFRINGVTVSLGTAALGSKEIGFSLSDETTVITTGTAKITFRMPFAMTVTAVRANVSTASSSGVVTVDINEAGVTILSTKLTIDANELTSETAAAPPVISDSALANDAQITCDIDTAGTGAIGLKVWIIGYKV